MRILNTINSPDDLKKLSLPELELLAGELRSYIIESVSKTGGHLSSNLGTVELAIALHYVFSTPADKLIWDVGHQCYAHKILTGRRDRMDTLRQLGGLSGFPKRDESMHDSFGTAHSSTSISAALGMAIAARLKDENTTAVAVIGDGAMTAGMAFEAMNNVGIHDNIRLLVILNDNDMSISPPVGALNHYFARLMSGQFYAAAKNVGKSVLKGSPILEIAKRFEGHAKGLLAPATLFEEFGFNYVGPIDGHDLRSLIPTLKNLKELKGPQFLHIVTKKGHGYKLAEADPVLYHGLGQFSPEKGVLPSPSAKPTYSNIFGTWLCDTAARNKNLIGITPAMREGSGMVEFSERFPDRYFDVAIAEQHAVTFAAGLACEGFKPVVAIYSTFLQRAYDQLIHDVALQNLDVTFALDRSGLVGADGATHAGNYDLVYLRCIPNMAVMAPSDENELRLLLTTAFSHKGPAAVRYPRGSGIGAPVIRDFSSVPFGKGRMIRKGKTIAILAFGTMAAPSFAAGEEMDATVIDMRFIKPIDRELIIDTAKTHQAIVTAEEGALAGGAGSAVMEVLAEEGLSNPVLRLGLPDKFIDHGNAAKLLSLYGLDKNGIIASVRKRFGNYFGAN